MVGVAKVTITPEFDPYTDENGNRRRDDGEPYEDKNGNGQFDSLWLGGFGPRQPTGLHDDLWARTVAVSVHGELFTLTSLDALGYSVKRIDSVKQRVMDEVGHEFDLTPERILVASTHTHAAPDNLGVFAPDQKPGWDDAYLTRVEEQATTSIVNALQSMVQAHLLFAGTEASGLVQDIDPPVITDPYVGIIQAVSDEDKAVMATLVSIANHPEAWWGPNTLISSDFPHYLRESVEQHFGGMAVYFSSNLGLMQTPNDTIDYGEELVELVGQTYATLVIDALTPAQPVPDKELVPGFEYERFTIALENPELYLGVYTDIAEGYSEYLYVTEDEPCDFFGCMNLPGSALRLGNHLTIVMLPGEFTPELVLGGIVSPDDYAGPYPDAPPEPILADHLETQRRFVIGLCGAEVGYFYPKMTFDMDAHWSQRHGPGPNAAMDFMTGLVELVDRLNSGYE